MRGFCWLGLVASGNKGHRLAVGARLFGLGSKIPLSEAKEGDVVILSGKASWQCHVGFLKGQGAQKLNLLGGNQND